MRGELKRVLDLQPSYSASNTIEMRERGALIRGPIRDDIEKLRPILARALGRFGDTFLVDASDGIGRKTELPWVRFASAQMSPHPTGGFYSVIHFSTDGSAVHVTVGCGSSRFVNGSFNEVPGPELKRQIEWARGVIIREFGSLAPFDHPIDYGARRPLPKSFERATACAFTIPYGEIDSADIEGILLSAALRLRAIYEAEAQGNNLPASEQEEIVVAAAVSPEKSGGGSQGYGLTAKQRRLVERRAMAEATRWLQTKGFEVTDMSSTMSFDLLAKSATETIKIEVKGTTSQLADAILMTANEVALHTVEKGKTGLIIVSDVRLETTAGVESAVGGRVEAMIGWDIGAWLLEPIAFRLRR